MVRSLGRKASRRFREARRLVVLEPISDDPAWVAAHRQDTLVEQPVRDRWRSEGAWRLLEDRLFEKAGYRVSFWTRDR